MLAKRSRPPYLQKSNIDASMTRTAVKKRGGAFASPAMAQFVEKRIQRTNEFDAVAGVVGNFKPTDRRRQETLAQAFLELIPDECLDASVNAQSGNGLSESQARRCALLTDFCPSFAK